MSGGVLNASGVVGKRNPYLDALRGVAVLLVVGHHSALRFGDGRGVAADFLAVALLPGAGIHARRRDHVEMDVPVAEMAEGDRFGARPCSFEQRHGLFDEFGHVLDSDRDVVLHRGALRALCRRDFVAQLPEGAGIKTDDRFAERPSAWPKFAGFLIAVCFVYSLANHFGVIYFVTNGKLGKNPYTQQEAASNEKSSTNAPAIAVPK